MNELERSRPVASIAELESLYGPVPDHGYTKETGFLHPHYRALIAASPFAVLATSGAHGLDASPRGDAAGFVHIEDDKTLLLPDRRGNNRIDSLRNIVRDPRVALLFLIPGIGETLRVQGRATIHTAPALLDRFGVDGKPPRSVLVIEVDCVFFQCSRAIKRSELWNPARHLERSALPSTGTILQDINEGRFDGDKYDRELPDRVKATLY
ncbi:MAG TPA: pyridoxamine 5'-phosphate oxidase family protein [Burkholderiaceae bacterium]